MTHTPRKINPYIQIDNIRTFSSDVDSEELIWHVDLEDRWIKVIHGNGWKFQFDNELPFVMHDNLEFFIKKNTWHRVIKGQGELVLHITFGD